jgi:arylsulfatase A-like enzyme
MHDAPEAETLVFDPWKGRLWPSALRFALGLGLVAGGGEAFTVALHTRLLLSFGERVLLGFVAVLAGLLLGAAVAVPSALYARFVRRPEGQVGRLAMAAAVAVFLVSAFYLWNGLRDLVRDGRWMALVATLLLPLAIAGAAMLNARHQYRKVELGWAPRLGWLGRSALAAVVLVGAGAATKGLLPLTSGGEARPGAPNVLLVTIDTLRRDHLGVYGEPEAALTPVFDAFAASGVLFTDAATPFPETVPAHATLFSALHPLRNGVLSNGHVLARHFLTLAERLSVEGWATGAFVSSFAVNARTGLDQGFSVYDDDFLPVLHGLNELRLAALATEGVLRFGDPARFPFLLERPAPATVSRAAAWIADQAGVGRKPFFCWVHFFEPHAPYEAHPGSPGNSSAPAGVDHREILSHDHGFDYTPEIRAELRRLYREEVIFADHALGELLGMLDRAGVSDRTVVVVMADHGEMLGEHGIDFNHHGLYDQAVRIPLAIRVPGRKDLPSRVDRQVRTQDVADTILAALGIRGMDPSEGTDLLAFANAPDAPSLGITLLGRRGASLEEGTLIGLRTGRSTGGNAVKYIAEPGTGHEEIYDLETDPEEMHDISAEQAEVLRRSRELVVEETKTRRSENTLLDPVTLRGLRALGYLK